MRGVLVFLMFLVILSPLFSELPDPLPEPVPLEFRHLLPSRNEIPDSTWGKIFLLGWNADGVMAVLTRESEAGERKVHLRLWDSVDDQEVLNQPLDDWGENWSSWWDFEKDSLRETLQKYHIEFSDTQLGVFPMILDDEYYYLAVKKKFFPKTQIIRQLQVSIHSTERGDKTIFSQTGIWRWITVLGYIPSPLENRVVLILLVQPMGWGGPKQPFRFIFTGINLKVGFHYP